MTTEERHQEPVTLADLAEQSVTEGADFWELIRNTRPVLA